MGPSSKARGPGRPKHTLAQRGVVMVITLVALAVLLIGAVALFRSSDTSSALAGQLGFRRDLKNQAERGTALAIKALKKGNLAAQTTRETSSPKNNYSAVRLETDARSGLPKILLQSDADFTGADYVININDADSSGDNAGSGVKVRYVIDRLCMATGEAKPANCGKTNVVQENSGQDSSHVSQTSASFYSVNLALYRISVRVDGPRGTQAFFQSTVALP